MAKTLKNISENYDLGYYTNEENIKNSRLVKETIEYFETGPGARVFKPLEFLNLLWHQYNFVNANIVDTDKVFTTLNALPLNNLKKHILFGFIIKWFGGYPLEAPLGIGNSEFHYKFRKQLLDKFLSYNGETPEKEFCKGSNEQRKKLRKLGIALSTAINNNIDATMVYNALDETQSTAQLYSSFDELFEVAVRNNAIGEFENKAGYLIQRSKYNFNFNVWLEETKGWEYGNETQYQTFLNKEIFKEFLKFYEDQQKKGINDVEAEKQSWQSGKREIAKHYEDWLNMSIVEKYNYSLVAYNEKFPKGTIEDFHSLEKEHLKERIKFYYGIGLPDAYEIKAVIERKKLLSYIDNLEKNTNGEQSHQVETKPAKAAVKTKPELEKIFSEIGCSGNQFWKGLPMYVVIDHFEVMTKRKNKKGNQFLTTEQLVSFLRRGFLNDTTQLKQKIECSIGEKGLVIKRFYEFFDLAVSQYGHPAKKEKFIRLFTDCFDNWEAKSIEPFFKPNKTKETW